MSQRKLDETTLLKIQALIQTNFSGRDELYAAAESLGDEDRKRVCQRLAEHLADHAAELQQIALANGEQPLEPADLPDLASALFDLIKTHRGDPGVIAAAETCEQAVIEAYDSAIETTDEKQAEGMLTRQRSDAEFGQRVLRSMKTADEKPSEPPTSEQAD